MRRSGTGKKSIGIESKKIRCLFFLELFQGCFGGSSDHIPIGRDSRRIARLADRRQGFGLDPVASVLLEQTLIEIEERSVLEIA